MTFVPAFMPIDGNVHQGEIVMQIRFVPVPRLPRWPIWAVAVAGVWIGLHALIHVLSTATHRPVVTCPFKLLTTLPCCTCGITRGFLSIASGNIPAAFRWNPLFFSLLGVVLIDLAMRLALGRAIRLEWTARRRRVAWTAGGVAIVANWIYVLAYVH